MKRWMWVPAYLLLACVIGCVLMIAVYSIPTGRIRHHVKESIPVYQAEGKRPTVSPGLEIGRGDNYTDSIMLRGAMYSDEKSAVYNAMRNPHYVSADIKGQVEELIASADDEYVQTMDIRYYEWYWHGYLVYVKPLFLFFNISEVRIIGMCVQQLLLFYVLICVFKRLGLRYALAYGAMAVFLNPVAISASIQFWDIYFITLLGSLFMLKRERELESKDGWRKLFFVIGIVVSFFDFLTYPLLTLGVLLALQIALHQYTHKKAFTEIFFNSMMWGLGYAGMWAGKWVFGSLLTRENIIGNGIKNVLKHTTKSGGEYKTFEGILTNLRAVNIAPIQFFAMLLLIAFVVLLFMKKINFKGKSNFIIPLACISLFPFMWYFVLKRHAVVHPWMEYRQMGVTVLCILFILCASYDINKTPLQNADS